MGDSIADYHRKVSLLADSLATTDKPLTNTEFATHLLLGLWSDFDPIVESLSTRLPSSSSIELLNHLLTFETRMNQQASSSPSTPEITANTVTVQTPSLNRGGRGPSRVAAVVAVNSTAAVVVSVEDDSMEVLMEVS